MVFFGPTGYWDDLSQEGRHLQSQLRERVGYLRALTRTLLMDLPEDGWKDVDDALEEIETVIEQRPVYEKTTDAVLARIGNPFELLESRIGDLYDASEGDSIFVPDTNAVLHNPELEAWEFPDAAKFTIILTPTLLVELDELKVNHRNEEIRERAESVISRIKGYRNRGELRTGVPLRKAGARFAPSPSSRGWIGRSRGWTPRTVTTGSSRQRSR
jgi:hypothetical protein